MTAATLLARRDAAGRILPPTPDDLAAIGPPTRDAIDAAHGSRTAAARALGISRRAMVDRLARATVDGEPLGTWAARAWPTRGGRTAVPVVRVEYVGTGYARERVYYLAAHGDVAAGAHVVRVPAVGKVRARVVCTVCKESKKEVES